MSTDVTVLLVLDKRIEAKLGEQSFLSWWVGNLTGDAIGSVQIQPNIHNLGDMLDPSPVLNSDFAIPHGSWQSLEMPFTVNRAGSCALRVQISVWTASGGRHDFRSEGSVTLNVYAPDSSGHVHISASSAIIKGRIPRGGLTVVAKGPVIYKSEGAAGNTASDLTVAGSLGFPDSGCSLEVPLVRTQVPGLFPEVDLRIYREVWQKSGRLLARELAFVYPDGRLHGNSAREGAIARLRLASYQEGHITFIVRGTSRKFRQLVPHCHEGEEQITGQRALLWPTDLLRAVSGPKGERWEIDDNPPFLGKGIEEALAFIGPAPFLEAKPIFDGKDRRPPAEIPDAEVRRLLERAWYAKGIELGYVRLEVV